MALPYVLAKAIGKVGKAAAKKATQDDERLKSLGRKINKTKKPGKGGRK